MGRTLKKLEFFPRPPPFLLEFFRRPSLRPQNFFIDPPFSTNPPSDNKWKVPKDEWFPLCDQMVQLRYQISGSLAKGRPRPGKALPEAGCVWDSWHVYLSGKRCDASGSRWDTCQVIQDRNQLITGFGSAHSPKFIPIRIGIPSWIPNLDRNSNLNVDLNWNSKLNCWSFGRVRNETRNVLDYDWLRPACWQTSADYYLTNVLAVNENVTRGLWLARGLDKWTSVSAWILPVWCAVESSSVPVGCSCSHP